jgi:hypothetical protein
MFWTILHLKPCHDHLPALSNGNLTGIGAVNLFLCIRPQHDDGYTLWSVQANHFQTQPAPALNTCQQPISWRYRVWRIGCPKQDLTLRLPGPSADLPLWTKSAGKNWMGPYHPGRGAGSPGCRERHTVFD